MAEPDQNILVMALLADFKESLREKFKSCSTAFDKLGGGDDHRIDRQEFHDFLASLGYDNSKLNEQLFRFIDDNGDDFICRGEFKLLFMGQNAELTEFKEQLRDMFKTRAKAFDRLGGGDDGRIEPQEFKDFLEKQLGYKDHEKSERLFGVIDDNKDGYISKAEFKALFQPQGETALVVEFKDTIKAKYRSCMDAFARLGGEDDNRITRKEFQEVLSQSLGFDSADLNDQLFNIIDDNNDGWISKNEFKALFAHHTMKIADFQESLKKHFKSRQQAFDRLGGSDDQRIHRKEFQMALCKDLGMDDNEENDMLFDLLDKDNDGYITKKEFKDFFAAAA